MALALESANNLLQFWDEYARTASKALAKQAARLLSIGKIGENNSCLSYKSFHRFHAVVGSRAMILNNIKYLTPMADLMNHQESTGSKDTFEAFHRRHSGGSISVCADREVAFGDQLFEEYSKLDNSLYLMTFGFVPTENSYHCVVIRSSCLPNLVDRGLRTLAEQVYPRLLNVRGVCVFRNGSFFDNDMRDYLTLVNLQSSEEKQSKCLQAYRSGDIELTDQLCFKYRKNMEATLLTIQQGARCSLHQAATSLKEDLNLLNNLLRQDPSPTRAILAVRFRVFEKQLLTTISRAGQ
jgi:hypothetical protein